jgi:methionyl-tRNA formyltransferase
VRVAFLGLPLAACLLAADGHEIVVAGLSRTDTVGRRRLRRLLGPERVFDKPKLDRAFAARIADLRADLLVSWFWTNRIPASVVAAARQGGIGVHPSLLPRHRGPDPTAWAILLGDEKTGVTCHRIADEYDTGDILAQEELPIGEDWDAWRLARALDRPSLRVLRDVCRRFAAGDPPAAVPQDESLATAAPFLDEEDQTIVWDAPTTRVLRQIRALSPSPGAFTEISGQTVTVLRASSHAAPALLETPGEAAWLDGRALVRTRDGAVGLEVVERDGVLLAAETVRDLLARVTPSA